MVSSNQIVPGMTISINGKLFRVESCVKVTPPKGPQFMKTKLRDLTSNDLVEKSFKLNQPLKDVSLIERKMEFLYLEGKDYLFLDIGNLNQILVPSHVIGDKINFLREGVEVKGSFYGDTIFAVELPQFLELMVTKIKNDHDESPHSIKIAVLEPGAEIEVPPFIGVGDVIKVATENGEFIQRV